MFKIGFLTIEWHLCFKKRWSLQLSERKTKNISSLRASSCTDNIINKFFETCKAIYENANFSNKPTNIWNCDETGFSGDQGAKTVIVRKVIKIPLALTGNNEKISYTANNCCNAAGDILPPFVVYEAKNRLFDKWCVGGPEKTVYTTSKSGWWKKCNFNNG